MALNSLNTLLLAVPARSRPDAAHRGAEVLGGSLSSEGRRAMQRRFRPAKPAPRMSCSRTPVETARARVRAAGLRGDALAAEHDTRAYQPVDELAFQPKWSGSMLRAMAAV